MIFFHNFFKNFEGVSLLPLIITMEVNTESTNVNDEKKQIYFTVIQNIQKTLELTTKLEENAKEGTKSLQSKLEDKLKKEKDLVDDFQNFKNYTISQRRGEKSLSQTILDDYEKETVKVCIMISLSWYSYFHFDIHCIEVLS